MQADLSLPMPLTRPQRKVAKRYYLHHVCLSACINWTTYDGIFMIFDTEDFYLNVMTH
jgi:hypothetical protein